MSLTNARPNPSSHAAGRAGPSVVVPVVSKAVAPSEIGSALSQVLFVPPPPQSPQRSSAPHPLPPKPCPAQNSSHIVSQQKGSHAQMMLQHVSSEQPGLPLAAQQSPAPGQAGLPPRQTPPTHSSPGGHWTSCGQLLQFSPGSTWPSPQLGRDGGQRASRAAAKLARSTRVAMPGQGQWVTMPRISPFRMIADPELPQVMSTV